MSLFVRGCADTYGYDVQDAFLSGHPGPNRSSLHLPQLHQQYHAVSNSPRNGRWERTELLSHSYGINIF